MKIILSDGTEIKGSCSQEGTELVCILHCIDLVYATQLFDDPEKTKRIIFCHDGMREAFEGFKAISSLETLKNAIQIRLRET